MPQRVRQKVQFHDCGPDFPASVGVLSTKKLRRKHPIETHSQTLSPPEKGITFWNKPEAFFDGLVDRCFRGSSPAYPAGR
jgi:hypothetical protein